MGAGAAVAHGAAALDGADPIVTPFAPLPAPVKAALDADHHTR